MKTLDQMLGIKYPIIQGGMANIGTGEFAAAVANAGGLGLIAAGGMSADVLREQIRIGMSKLKPDCEGKIGVNLMLMNPEVSLQAEVIVEEGIKVVTTGAGMPGKFMPAWKEAGIFVMPVVSATSLAKRVEKDGADAVIAEGGESGGHVGEMTTMTLVPQVIDAVSIPVVAAGGIATGKQMAAAMALGACGIQVGTVLLASNECPIHDNYKEAVINAKDNDTIVTGRISGSPVRIIKNQMAREYVKKEKEGAQKMELEMYTLGSLRRAVFDGDTKTGSLMAGQVAGSVNEIKPLATIFEELYTGCKETIVAMSNIFE